jgi:hypothetical protein
MPAAAGRVYFLGAGASKQDSYPLSSELKHGIAWAILNEGDRFAPLRSHLEYLYRVDDTVLQRSADTWDSLREGVSTPVIESARQVPDVTDLLSTLDWMIREQSSFGPGAHGYESNGASLPTQLATIRDYVVQALCYCLGTYRDLGSAPATRDLMQLVAPGDSLITTNWDLLLDAARDARFGSADVDYGTTGNVVLEGHEHPKTDVRPKLLKLHGSLSWRYCQRCQRLVIDPLHHVAGERKERATCACTCRFSELIVTPGFVREYRNVHLLNIWREALLTLAQAAEWVFIGSSLPADDIGVRALLMKARCVHEDLFDSTPRVTIVSGRDGRDHALTRYRSLLDSATLDPHDFGDFVRRAPALGGIAMDTSGV